MNNIYETGERRRDTKLKVFLFSLLFIVYCLIPSVSYPETVAHLNAQIEMERKQLKEIEERIHKQKTKVAATKMKEDSILLRLNMINRSLKIIQNELKVYNLKLGENHDKMKEIEIKLKEIESVINKQKRFLSDRLKVLYKEGNLPYINLALSATDFTDFIQRTGYLKRIAEHDSAIIKDFFEKQKEIEGYKQVLLKSEDEIMDLKGKADQKKEQILNEKNEKEKFLREIKGKRVVYETIQEELEDSSYQLMALIESLEKKRREAHIASPPKGGGDFAVMKGSLPWPIKGSIVTHFGIAKESRFNTYLFNNGIEISSAPDVKIKTIYAGDIIFADWFKGYGKLIIIDHGEGYYSLYGHLDEIMVAIGEKVEGGDIIGKIGDTDSINGYTLYFEIRKIGKPEDPLAWLIPQKMAYK
jgi:septal ring factor EnvC (AmiA/AmiB activator)